MKLHENPLAVVVAAVAVAAFAAVPAPARSAAPDEPRDDVGWHVVEPGETLQSITERYLGTPKLWQANWKLNPDIADPDLLRPGQRIQVIRERQIPAREAEIKDVANDVDKKLRQEAWRDASVGDRLQPLDGVRTSVQSSAELGFDDGSSLKLTEHSQVFLKEISTSLTGVKRGSIEIVEGQAELELKAARPESIDVEIIVGTSTARPRVGSSGRALTRTRKPETGGSQVMVYGGSSEVEAGGRKVAVGRGMGTSVPEGGVPAPPEKLLPAPTAVTPARRSRWGFANPRFAWRPVTGAASYTLEVCRDPGCGGLVARAVDLGETSWQAPALPRGDLYWRVTAVATSGLDGFPSRAVPFEILTDRPDLGPPVVVASRIGAGHADGGTLVLGRGANLRLEAFDDASGVAEVRYRWDGGSWRRWRGGDLEPPAGAGEHRLDLQATDRIGRTSRLWTVPVRRDADGPEPPGVERIGAGPR